MPPVVVLKELPESPLRGHVWVLSHGFQAEMNGGALERLATNQLHLVLGLRLECSEAYSSKTSSDASELK